MFKTTKKLFTIGFLGFYWDTTRRRTRLFFRGQDGLAQVRQEQQLLAFLITYFRAQLAEAWTSEWRIGSSVKIVTQCNFGTFFGTPVTGWSCDSDARANIHHKMNQWLIELENWAVEVQDIK